MFLKTRLLPGSKKFTEVVKINKLIVYGQKLLFGLRYVLQNTEIHCVGRTYNCRLVRNIAKSDCYLRRACPHGTTRLPLGGF